MNRWRKSWDLRWRQL